MQVLNIPRDLYARAQDKDQEPTGTDADRKKRDRGRFDDTVFSREEDEKKKQEIAQLERML